MEKVAYNNQNYPQMPPQMNAATGSAIADEHMPVAAPPSYEQATTSAAASFGASVDTQTYPPVQVLPTPSANQQQQPQQPQQQQQQHQQYQQSPPVAQSYYGNGVASQAGNYAGHTTSTYVTLQRQGVPPMVQQQQPQPQSVVIIQQQAMLPLGPEPTFIFCPSCNIQKMTRIEYEPSARTHIMAALLCVLGLWCCVCLPYCAGSCMNTNHYCGNCNKFLGSYGNSL